MTRIAQFLAQVLFASNDEYFVSDKYTNRLLNTFKICPPDFMRRLALVLSKPGVKAIELGASFELLSALWRGTA